MLKKNKCMIFFYNYSTLSVQRLNNTSKDCALINDIVMQTQRNEPNWLRIVKFQSFFFHFKDVTKDILVHLILLADRVFADYRKALLFGSSH